MKRSKMVEIIRCQLDNYDEMTASNILTQLEFMGMKPPGYMKPIPADETPLIPGDIKNDAGIWCTPGIQQWEPE